MVFSADVDRQKLSTIENAGNWAKSELYTKLSTLSTRFGMKTWTLHKKNRNERFGNMSQIFFSGGIFEEIPWQKDSQIMEKAAGK